MIARNSIHHGNCYDILPKIEPRSVNLILADMPYGETAHSEDKRLIMHDYIELKMKRGAVLYLSYQEWCVRSVERGFANHALRIWEENHKPGIWSLVNELLTPTGNILFFAQGHFFSYLIETNKKQYKYDIVWNKKLITDFLNAPNKPVRQHESLLVFNNSIQKAVYNPQFSKGKPLHGKGTKYNTRAIKNNNYGRVVHVDDRRKGSTDKHPTTIWYFPKAHPSKSEYRTVKPVALLERAILTYSQPGDLVLDFTAGSGGVGEAAILSGRDYLLIDNSAEAIESIYKRLSSIQTAI